VQGEELRRPFASTSVGAGVEGDLQPWAGGAGRGIADERVHQSVYLRVIPTASLSTLPSGFPIFSMVSMGVAMKNISASMSACCTFWISSCVMFVCIRLG